MTREEVAQAAREEIEALMKLVSWDPEVMLEDSFGRQGIIRQPGESLFDLAGRYFRMTGDDLRRIVAVFGTGLPPENLGRKPLDDSKLFDFYSVMWQLKICLDRERGVVQ